MDEIVVFAMRLPAGESPFMNEAVVEAAQTMNSDRETQMRRLPVNELIDSDEHTALRVLGLDPDALTDDVS